MTILESLRRHEVDVALFQEIGELPETLSMTYHRLSNIPQHADYGTAVVAVNPDVNLEPIDLEPADAHATPGNLSCSHPGTIAAAKVTMESSSFIAVSVYGRMYQAGNGTTYASTTVHRIISDLASVLHRYRGSPEVLVAGDFNCTTQWGDERDRLMDASVLARLESHQLVDLLAERYPGRVQLDDCFCPSPKECAHVRTLRHANKPDSRPFHIDYAYASPGLAPRVNASLLDTPEIWELSDHCVLMFDIG